MDGGAWWAAVHGVAKSQTQLSNFTFTFHFHALEKEMATHSSVLAWRILGTAEPGGLPSMGSHRVGYDWSDLAAAAAGWNTLPCSPNYIKCTPVTWLWPVFPGSSLVPSLTGTSLVFQWLKLCASNAGGVGLIPGQGTKIPHASWQKKNKNKKTQNRSNIVTHSIKTSKRSASKNKKY